MTLAIILCGGRATRMGGRDKAALQLAGRRLLDHVLARLAPQVDAIALAGRENHGTMLPVIADAAGHDGPAAALAGTLRWMDAMARPEPGFLTVPVDGPLLPADLADRLLHAGASTYAADAAGDHPTFAYWRRDALAGALADSGPAPSLRRLAGAVQARRVPWAGDEGFANVNTPADLARLEALLAARQQAASAHG